jgi:hypothetical protein
MGLAMNVSQAMISSKRYSSALEAMEQNRWKEAKSTISQDSSLWKKVEIEKGKH